MPLMATYIKKLEGYADLEVSIIRTTKINKVLKALIKLNTIPRDEEFQFRKRSVELLSQWNKILGSEPADGDHAGEKETTNGVHDEKSEEDDKKEDAPAPAPAEKPVEETPIVPPEPEKSDEAEKPAEPEAAPASGLGKTDAPAPAVVDQAPASAEAAATATEVVKETE
jgi:creatinine amidohydrolase/Fe(II)-dependent formamide hydrolase-like protein